MKTVFFTIVDDRLYYPEGTHILINSFKRFHPDIDLVVFRQDIIDKVFKERKEINFYNAKPTFAKLLTDKYDTVVNIDADHVVTARLTEIVDNPDWEVGAVANENEYENASVENVSEDQYVQAGMVGSRNKRFWDIWEDDNRAAMSFLRKENDILNLTWYNNPEVQKMNRVIWDKDKNYLGCKSLGGEPLFRIEDDKLMYKGEQVKAYHFARGPVFPKLDFPNMPFTEDVKQWLLKISTYGQSVTIGGVGAEALHDN